MNEMNNSINTFKERIITLLSSFKIKFLKSIIDSLVFRMNSVNVTNTFPKFSTKSNKTKKKNSHNEKKRYMNENISYQIA